MRISRSGMVFVVGIALSLVAVAACQPDGRTGALGERIDSLEQRLTAIETGVDAPVRPVDLSDERLTAAAAGIGALAERIDSPDHKLTAIETGVDAPVGPVEPPDQRLTAAEAGIGP